jgi:vitamin K-dependent gamma-carboxylase
LRGSVKHIDSLPALWLWLFRFKMGLVYFYGGIAKLDPDWLDGRVAGKLMDAANRGTILEPLLKYDWMILFYSWSGLGFDLVIPFLMLSKPLRLWAFFAVVLFHTNNHYVFPIGVFPALALMLTLLYFDAGFPRKIIPQKIREIVSTSYRKILACREDQVIVPSQIKTPRILVIFIVFYIFIQLLLPFRHLMTPGWTTWHEEGHYFAWRMMLRHKSTRIQFNITHPVTGEKRYADPKDYLNHVQYTKFAGSPAMVLQFAHYLDYLVRKNVGFDPKITANVEVSINGREFKQMVDSDLDLSEIPKFKAAYLWIRPFGER